MGDHGHAEIQGSSDRSFGLVWTAALVIIGAWPLLDGELPRLWALVAAAALLGLSLLKAEVLAPLNRAWMRFGLLLNRFVSPVIMGVVFFGLVMPTGMLRRLAGADPLRRRRASAAGNSYWVERPRSNPPGSMKDQF
jgi:hypothetical protein